MRMLSGLVGVGLVALASGGAAVAQARPDSLGMTCAQARGLVRSRGAVILGSGPNIYDRIVIDRRFCAITDGLQTAWVPTRDTRQCMVGYTCIPLKDAWPNDFWGR
jgi:hypothetical protein